MEYLLYALIAGFAPGVYWLIYFYRKDWQEPEPKLLVVKAYVLGMLSIIPAALINTGFFCGPLITPVAVAPVVEETLKFLVLLIFIYPKDEFDEPMDGILYASAVALGFASVENVIYISNGFESGNGWWIAGLRAVLSVPGHALFTIMSGYALAVHKCSRIKHGKGSVAGGLFAAMALHSIFNFLAVFSIYLSLGLVVFMFAAWKKVKNRITYAELHSPFKAEKYFKKNGVSDRITFLNRSSGSGKE